MARTTLKYKGYLVNYSCLMKQMNLMVIFPKPNLLKVNKEYKIFPYLLRERAINKVNEIFAIDISYIRAAWLFLLSRPYHGLAQPLSAELALIKHLNTSFFILKLWRSLLKSMDILKYLTATRGCN